MQIKTIAMMLVAGCAIGLSTGCVKQEDYDNMVNQLTTERKQAEDVLNKQLSEKDAELKSAQDSARTLKNDLRDSAILNEELKQSAKDLKASLAEAKSKVSTLE